MWIADKWQDYELIDCGDGEKLERWDRQVLVRPDPQAIWETPHSNPNWKRANANDIELLGKGLTRILAEKNIWQSKEGEEKNLDKAT